MLQPHTVRDRISFRSSTKPLKAPALSVVTALQQHTADVQIESLSLTLVVLASAVGIDPHELITRGKRQLQEAREWGDETIEAIADYGTGELK